MLIKFNDEVILELSELDLQILKNDLREDELENEIKGRLIYSILTKKSDCEKRIMKQWKPILSAENDMLPTRTEALLQMIFADPRYKSRTTRDEEAAVAQATPTNSEAQGV